MNGKTLNASFTSKRASLAGDKLIIDADQTVLSGLPGGEKKGTLLGSIMLDLMQRYCDVSW